MSVDALVALVSVAQAKAVLNISVSTEDSVLESLIDRASAFAAKYCGRNFVSATRTEYYDGDGSDSLILNTRPVTVVASVHVDSLRQWGADVLVDPDDYIIDGPAGILELWNNGGTFTKGKGNIKVVYTAGYVAGTTVPHDLEEAVLLIVQHHYRRIYQDQRIGLLSETLDDRTMAYSAEAIPAKARETLDRYVMRMVHPGGHA